MIKHAVRRYLDENDLPIGTHPENVVTMRLHRWKVPHEPQHHVGRYRLDFAFIDIGVALEVDGPHHQRPDVAVKDAFRDEELRARGWIVFRINVGDGMEEQLSRVVQVINLMRAANVKPPKEFK